MSRIRTKIDIPKDELELLKKWSNYPKDQKELIFKAFEAIEPTLDLDTLKSKFAEQTKLGKTETEDIFRFSVTLYHTYYNIDMPMDEYIEVLLDFFKSNEELQLEVDEKPKVTEILARLLKMDKSLGIISKTLALIHDYPYIFLDSRIITDFRPIFSQNIDEAPTNAIIIHNFKLVYGDFTEMKELYISMTHKDLVKLEKVIKRAILKERTLRKFCQEKKINILRDENGSI